MKMCLNENKKENKGSLRACTTSTPKIVWTLCKTHNTTEGDNLLILFDIYCIKNSQ